MSCASTWRRRLPLHILAILSIFTLCLSANPVRAQTHDSSSPAPVLLSPGFQTLVDTAPDVVGQPLEGEHIGDVDGSTIVRTTTGLLYWQPDLAPSWTDGYDRLTLDGVHQVVQWVGDLLKPQISLFGFSLGGGGPGSDAVDRRIYCIEGIESNHSSAARWQYNPTPVWNGEHAQGWLGWLPSTAAVWGASIGNRDSEWAAARRMLTSQPEKFLRTQFAGIGNGSC